MAKLNIFRNGKRTGSTSGNLSNIAAEWRESIGSDTGNYAVTVEVGEENGYAFVQILRESGERVRYCATNK